jgi:dethiobiotin synthetase
MPQSYIISGTDTDIGKTVVAAMLAGALRSYYWKPIQSGLDGETDSEKVQRLSGLPHQYILREAYRLTEPLSPHRSAELDGVTIDPLRLTPPPTDGPLLIEGAGGLMVPLTRHHLLIDQIKAWHMPVILVARTALGTINHTLLSIEALRVRKISLHGIIFVGDDYPDTQRTIGEISGAKILGRLPFLEILSPESLRAAFMAYFKNTDFLPS